MVWHQTIVRVVGLRWLDNKCCDSCRFYNWYYDWCAEWKCEVDYRGVCYKHEFPDKNKVRTENILTDNNRTLERGE